MKYELDEELLIGIGLLNEKLDKKVELASNGITYRELEKLLGDKGCRKWQKEVEWLDDDWDNPFRYNKGHIFYNTKDYPIGLGCMYNAPFMLSWIGNKPTDVCGNFETAKNVVITGDKCYQDDIYDATCSLTKEFCDNNIKVWTTYQNGVEMVANKCCVEMGKPTFCLIENGLNKMYFLKKDVELYHKICEYGGFVSAYPANENYSLEKDIYTIQVLSNIADSVILMRCKKESRPLVIVREALNAGKDVFVHSAGRGSGVNYKGSQSLIMDGVMIINNYNDCSIYTLGMYKKQVC